MRSTFTNHQISVGGWQGVPQASQFGQPDVHFLETKNSFFSKRQLSRHQTRENSNSREEAYSSSFIHQKTSAMSSQPTFLNREVLPTPSSRAIGLPKINLVKREDRNMNSQSANHDDQQEGNLVLKKIKEKHLVNKQQKDLKSRKNIDFINPVRYATDDLKQIELPKSCHYTTGKLSPIQRKALVKRKQRTLEQTVILESILPFLKEQSK